MYEYLPGFSVSTCVADAPPPSSFPALRPEMWKLCEIEPVFFSLNVTLPHGIAPEGLSVNPISYICTVTVVFFGCAHVAAVAAEALPPKSAAVAAVTHTARAEPATAAGRCFIRRYSFRQGRGLDSPGCMSATI